MLRLQKVNKFYNKAKATKSMSLTISTSIWEPLVLWRFWVRAAAENYAFECALWVGQNRQRSN